MTQLKISPKFDAKSDLVLYNGDCLDLLPTVPSGRVKLIVTSPPYNIGKSYEKRLILSDYVKQQKAVITECVRVLHPQGSICWQVGNYVKNGAIVPLDVVLYPIFESLGLLLRNRIVWHFGHGLHAKQRFSGRYEVILWFTNSKREYTFNLDPVREPQKYPNKRHFKGPNKGKLSGNPLGKNPSDVWEIPNVKANHIEKTIHPCQFPVELIERLVLSLTNKRDWVLDPFIGVGSTAIAALAHGRRAIGAELEREYVEVTVERVRRVQTGQLLVRPRERSVYDPNNGSANIPPRPVTLGSKTPQLNLSLRNASKGRSRS